MNDKPSVLVTGGAGYIGSHAVKALAENDFPVVVFDNLERGWRQPIEVLQDKYGGIEFYEGDLKEKAAIEKVFEEEDITAVLHFAALCSVSESMEQPGRYFRNNVLGTLNLLETMQQAGVARLVFSSTCAVYGDNQYLPVDEKHPLDPNSPYGASKMMAEEEISWFSQVYDLRHVILRYFNVAGAAESGLIGDSKKPSQLLVQNAVRGALEIEPFKLTCPEVDTPDGTPIRDYVNVEDLADAHLKALDYLDDQGNDSNLFNIGTGTGYSVLEIVEKVQEITGHEFPTQQGEKRQGEWAEIYADNSKAKSVLGWRPERDLADTVESLVKWYKKHPDGWDY